MTTSGASGTSGPGGPVAARSGPGKGGADPVDGPETVVVVTGRLEAGLTSVGQSSLAMLKVVAERLGTRALTVPKVFGPVVPLLVGLTGVADGLPVIGERLGMVACGSHGCGGGSLELHADYLEVGKPTLDGGEEPTDPVPVRHVEVRGLTYVLEVEEVAGVEILDTLDDEVDVAEEALALDEARDLFKAPSQDVKELVADHPLVLTPNNFHDPGVHDVEVMEGKRDVVEEGR